MLSDELLSAMDEELSSTWEELDSAQPGRDVLFSGLQDGCWSVL